jgi:uncharacterized Ntn-hydrolase superfamily protein
MLYREENAERIARKSDNSCVRKENATSFRRPKHTFSIVSRDPKTGEIGVAVQSHWFGVGADVSWAEAGAGAVATQAFADPSYGPKGLELMRHGKSASEALKQLINADPREEARQVAMVDAKGRAAAHTGKRCMKYAGHKVGDGYSVQANMMLNNTVPSAMARMFERTRGDLADRMMAALEAAQKAGGDIRGKQSAAMLVVKAWSSGEPWADRLVDLRVDDHPEPIVELRRLLSIARAYKHMNAGDVAIEKNDVENAMKEYNLAMRLAEDNMEMAFWSALALALKGNLSRAMPIFKKVFSADENWVELLKRLPKTGMIPSDKAGYALLRRILNEAAQQ